MRNLTLNLVAALAAIALSLPGNLALGQADSQPILERPAMSSPERARAGMVVSQSRIASEVGARILADGGNAVDAAVAVGFALAVVLPRAGNLGGGGFMLIHMAGTGETVAIDYREMAPAAAHRDMFLDPEGNVDRDMITRTLHASGVPGSVRGLHLALDKYGTMDWKEVILPARKLARDGFIVSFEVANGLETRRERLERHAASRAQFFKPDGSPYRAGDRLRQPDLAWSLRRLMKKGPDAFYTGRIAEKIVAFMEDGGGQITMGDLANYRAVERHPAWGEYRGYRIASMPPPSSGGIHLLQILNVLEQYPMGDYGFGSARSLHVMTEAMRRAYADRSQHLGDPDYYKVPVAWLTGKEYGRKIAAEISEDRATPSDQVAPGVAPGPESPDTTHYSVMDRWGNAVATTTTLNLSYGSGIVVPGAGFLLNNEMDDFSAKPGVPNAFGLLGAEANAVEAGKRPLSAMTPTILFAGERPFMVTGSPGGGRIITTVLQTIVNVIDHGMNLSDAVDAPRMHHQWKPDILYVEPGFSPDTLELLRAKGHTVEQSSAMGAVQAIMFDGELHFGAADPRRPFAGAIGLCLVDRIVAC